MSSRIIYSIYGLNIFAPDDVVSEHVRSELEQGLYELDEAGGLRDVLDRDAPVVELGAGIGVVSCVVNRMLADPSGHVAVEMHPAAYAVLEQNRVLNGCEFRSLLGAVLYDAEADDVLRPPAPWDPSHRLLPQSRPVALTLAKIVDETGWDRFNLVSDLEGAELPLFEHEMDLLREKAVTINLEIHPHVYGPKRATGVVTMLQDNGFELAAVAGGCVFGFRRAS